jgi:hypothetical protein
MIDFLAFCVTGFWKFCGIIVVIYTLGWFALKITQVALTGLALMIWGPKK